MPKQFRELRERLLRAGVAPRHVRRYLGELQDHVADLRAEEQANGRSPADAEAAALKRLGTIEALAQAAIEEPELQAWTARAPWAVLCLAPLAVLAAAFFAACVYLWLGWKIFLPGAVTPFGAGAHRAMFAIPNLYFQAGKAFYFGCPALVGWGIVIAAARQRLKFLWPAAGLALIAWMGASARIYAHGNKATGAMHIRMSFFSFGPAMSLMADARYAVVFFALTLGPYIVWRLYQQRELAEQD